MNSPTLECDLVMKGGVTSGTVYPKAIARLAETYRLRCIGGTSAGAIAAAVAAAAEYRRQMGSLKGGGDYAGFDLLKALPEDLGKPGKRGTGPVLLELFQPQKPFRGLLRFLLSFAGNDRREQPGAGGATVVADPPGRVLQALLIGKIAWYAMRSFPLLALVGAAAGLALVWALGFRFTLEIPLARWFVPLLLIYATATAGALYGVWRALMQIPANGFGMCLGYAPPEHAGAKRDLTQLTSFLFDLIQRTAGRTITDPPLTFGELKSAKVEFRAMTTNLSYGLPNQLPFDEDEPWAFFSEAELSKRFPPEVINHLKAYPPARYIEALPDGPSCYQRSVARICREQQLLPLPDAENLPVVVAVRLSLSFPALLSAMPLYLFDQANNADDAAPAQQCWFSDGGLSSNFPLHLFDAALPVRPTFAFNLEEVEPGFPDEKAWLPKTNREGLRRKWNGLNASTGPGNLAGFGLALINVMQNWRDNALLRLPGYRDRIAVIRLEPHEGGLNLNMPRPLITALADRGAAAADKLLLHFDPARQGERAAADISTSWDNHRWVRLLSTLAASEQLLDGIKSAWSAGTACREQLDPAVTREAPSYSDFTQAQRNLAVRYLDELSKSGIGKPPNALDKGTPRPRMRYRLRADT